MKIWSTNWRRLLLPVLIAGGLSVGAARAADSTNIMVWNLAKDRVDADVHDLSLLDMLQRIAADTGWHIYVEPGSPYKASVKFKQRPSGDALRLLLGDLNYALVPQTNSAAHLYVFRTSMARATQMVGSSKAKRNLVPRRVPNELIVRVKHGVDIDRLAQALGAKVTGRLPEYDTYRLEFPDAASAEAAKLLMANNPDVQGVDYNYYFDAPQNPRELTGVSAGTASLKLKAADGNSKMIIGVIDTAVQPLGGDYDNFVLPGISVAGESTLDPNIPWHGTIMTKQALDVVAGITGGETQWQVLPVNIYGGQAETTSWNMAMGIKMAVDAGAKILNISSAGPASSPVLQSIIQDVSGRGIPIYAAAGNEPVTTPSYPAAYSGVIAVTSLYQGHIAPYANTGSFVDIAAPDTTVVYFKGQTWGAQGTSSATAYTTGLAAGLADKTHRSWPEIQAAIAQKLAVPR